MNTRSGGGRRRLVVSEALSSNFLALLIGHLVELDRGGSGLLLLRKVDQLGAGGLWGGDWRGGRRHLDRGCGLLLGGRLLGSNYLRLLLGDWRLFVVVVAGLGRCGGHAFGGLCVGCLCTC